jgi:hypothetical protein
MKLDHIINSPRITLWEARARIEHPEDMILDQGVQGAHAALQILKSTAERPQQVSLKWDGSPSLIMGWRNGEFILTDKAGFSAKSYDGLTRSQDAIRDMILARKQKDASPEAQAARAQYAAKISGLYNKLKHVVPPNFPGFIQGDLMYTQTPQIVQGAYEFQPVKVKYRIPVHTDLGKQIGASQVGIVFHSKYDDPTDADPQAVRDLHELGFQSSHGVLILPHEVTFSQTLSLDDHAWHVAQSLIKNNENHIRQFLDPVGLTHMEIKTLPGILKSFVAHKAQQGDDDFSQAPAQFIEYVQSGNSKVSVKMAPRIINWIHDHVKGYNTIWQFMGMVVGLKMDLKRQMDTQTSKEIHAQLHDEPGHEGFVSVTPDGVIKLVDRATFMKKTLTEQHTVQADAPHRVVFTFLRANPPTTGHVKVIRKVAQVAQGSDYWIFLSHSQDAKQNPLSWHQKAHFLGKMTPSHKSHLAVGAQFDQVKTPLLAADWLYAQGYRDWVMVVGSDRVDDMTKLLSAWNSEEIRDKYGRDAVQIEIQSAGERDPDSDQVSGMSATKMRNWAAQGDSESFIQHSGLPDSDAQHMYDLVVQALQNKKKVQEMWGLGKPELQPDRTQPPATTDAQVLANWVQDVIMHAKQAGKDPVWMLSLKNPLGVWAPLMKQLGAQGVQQVRHVLIQEAHMAHMLDQAVLSEPGGLREQHDASSGTIVKLKLTKPSAQKLSEWCASHSLNCVHAHKLHMTIIFSPDHLPELYKLNHTAIKLKAQPKYWRLLGNQTLALCVHAPQADVLHDKLRMLGATHEYDTFISHVSVNYVWSSRKPLPAQVPDFTLEFDLIQVEPIDANWKVNSRSLKR